MSDPPKPAATTRAQRQQQLDERTREVRRALAAKFTGRSEADVWAEATASTAAQQDTSKRPPSSAKPIGEKLPLAARIATAHPDRMINVPVCEADLSKYQGRPFDKEAWLKAVEKVLLVHDFGNVHHAIVLRACEKLADAAESGRGMAQWTYELWASFARCCRSTMHKIVRALWDAELVRILNPFFWVGREQRRAANAYFPMMPPGTAPPSPEPAAVAETGVATGAVKALKRMEAAVRELLPTFPGLAARVFGMNTSPLRQERRAAPS